MLKRLFQFIKGKSRAKRPLSSIQVEITSRCTARCITCPRTVLAHWQEGDMDLSLFRALADGFSMAGHIHLSGWGEPLLHPDLAEMIRIVKAKGASAGFTTSGQHLEGSRLETLLDAGLDLVAVSLAGSDPNMHDSIRAGTSFDRIIKNIRGLNELKEKRGLAAPSLVISFIMLKKNLNQLPEVIELAAELKADRLSAINLDCTPSRELNRLKAFSARAEERQRFKSFSEKMARKAAKRGVELRLYPLVPDEQPICDADPLRNLYVSFDGCVSPCVYLGLPVEFIERYMDGQSCRIGRRCFGYAGSRPLEAIFQDKKYAQFRKAFADRLSMTAELYSEISCDFELLERAEELDSSYQKGLAHLKPPKECRCCWKLYGV